MAKRLFVFSALMMSVLLAPVAAQAQAYHDVSTQDIEVFDTIINPCNNEAVTLLGIVRFRQQFTYNASGGLDLTAHFTNQGIDAVGETGIHYEFVGTSSQTAHFPDALANGTVGKFLINALLVSQGSASNSHLSSQFHFTINANGVLTSLIDKFEATCQP